MALGGEIHFLDPSKQVLIHLQSPGLRIDDLVEIPVRDGHRPLPDQPRREAIPNWTASGGVDPFVRDSGAPSQAFHHVQPCLGPGVGDVFKDVSRRKACRPWHVYGKYSITITLSCITAYKFKMARVGDAREHHVNLAHGEDLTLLLSRLYDVTRCLLGYNEGTPIGLPADGGTPSKHPRTTCLMERAWVLCTVSA